MTNDESRLPADEQQPPTLPLDESEEAPRSPPAPPVVESSQEDDSEPSDSKSKDAAAPSGATHTRKQKSDRIARLTFQELQPYFTMPLYEAASKLKICGTVLKRISRRCGIPTWPFRQIRDLNSRIDSLKGLMETAHGRKLDAMSLELSQLEKTRDYILETGQVGEYRSKPAQAKKESSDTHSRDFMGGQYDHGAEFYRRDTESSVGYPPHLFAGAALADAAYLHDLAVRGYDYRAMPPMAAYGDLAHPAAPGAAPAMRDYHAHRAMFGMPWFSYLSQQLPGQPMPESRSGYPLVSPPISPHVDARFDPMVMPPEMRHVSGQKRSFDHAAGAYGGAPAGMVAGYGSSSGMPYDAMSLHRSLAAAQRARYHTVEDGDSLQGDSEDRMSKRSKWNAGASAYPNADWKALLAASAAAPQAAVESRI